MAEEAKTKETQNPMDPCTTTAATTALPAWMDPASGAIAALILTVGPNIPGWIERTLQWIRHP